MREGTEIDEEWQFQGKVGIEEVTFYFLNIRFEPV